VVSFRELLQKVRPKEFQASEFQGGYVQVMQEGQTIKHQCMDSECHFSDQERTAIDFDDHGAKLFVTSMMTAELIGEAPAVPPKTSAAAKASTAAESAEEGAAAAAATATATARA